MKIVYRKSFILVTLLLASSLLLISWSQPWFTIEGAITHSLATIEVSGQIAATALAALGILGLAILAALSLARRVLQKILGLLIILLGITVVWIVTLSLISPIHSSLPSLSNASGLLDVEAVNSQINAISVSLWPAVAVISGILYVFSGTVTLVFSSRWKVHSSKYESSNTGPSVARKSDAKVDQWDTMSAGLDPTSD